jgi:hypothetical protein
MMAIAEIFMRQQNYQSAANEFRAALNGDLKRAWIEASSHLNLGTIFDIELLGFASISFRSKVPLSDAGGPGVSSGSKMALFPQNFGAVGGSGYFIGDLNPMTHPGQRVSNRWIEVK